MCKAYSCIYVKILPGTDWQYVNGSPVNPLLQEHMGVWLITEHAAFEPHEPGQGSVHFWLIHDKWLGHSGLIVHSGLHDGGVPT